MSTQAAKGAAAPAPVRVRAKRDGFYNGQRVRVGKTFTLKRVEDLGAWMERIDPATPDDLAAATQPKRKERVILPAGASVDREVGTKQKPSDDDVI